MNTGSVVAEKRDKSFVTPGSIQEAVKAGEKPQNHSEDAIDSSHDALLLTEALHTAQNAPDSRPEKVQALRELIDSDSYRIDNFRLAAALLREESQLFQL